MNSKTDIATNIIMKLLKTKKIPKAARGEKNNAIGKEQFQYLEFLIKKYGGQKTVEQHL